jgi:hypothetical protein
MKEASVLPKSPFEWTYRIFAPYPLHFAIMSKQISENLTRSKAFLLFALRGAYEEGKLSEADYEVLKAKYSVTIPEAQEMKKVTPAQLRAKAREEENRHNYNRKMNRHFGEVLSQWSGLKDSAKRHHLKEAEKHKTLKNAKLLLDLAKPNAMEVTHQ